MVYVVTFVHSEAAFMGMVTWFLIALHRRRVPAAILLAAAASMTRYTGVVCILVGVLMLVAWRDRRWWMFGLLSSLPLGLWLVRNWMVAGSLAGSRPAATVDPAATLATAGTILGGWLLPGVAAVAVIWAAALLAVRGSQATVAGVYGVVYSTVVIGSGLLIALEPMNVRLLAPAFPALIIVAVSAATRLPAARPAVVVLAIMLAGQVATTVVRVPHRPAPAAMRSDHVLRPLVAGCEEETWDCLS